MHRRRDHGALVFFDLRDRSGLVQIVADPQRSARAYEVATTLRGEYVVRDERALAGDTTSIELPLGDDLFRVHLLGRDRGGRLVRRAIVSGLTRETWPDRWERRASAS